MQPRVSTELLGLDSDGAAVPVPAVVVVVVAAVLGVVVGVASAVAGVVVEEAAVAPDVGSCASPPWPLLGSFGTSRATSSQAPLPRAVSIAICVPSGTRGVRCGCYTQSTAAGHSSPPNLRPWWVVQVSLLLNYGMCLWIVDEHVVFKQNRTCLTKFSSKPLVTICFRQIPSA